MANKNDLSHNSESDSKAVREKLVRLERIKQEYYSFLDNCDDYINLKDSQHRYTAVSKAFVKLLARDRKYIIGKTDFDLFENEHALTYFEQEKKVLLNGECLIGIEEPYKNALGELGWISTSKWPIFDSDGNIIGLVGVSRDITKHKYLEAQLIKQASYDQLTQLYNRKHFMELGSELLKSKAEDSHKMAIYFIDLDHFKFINDTYGHEAGDVLLKSVANRMSNVSCSKKSSRKTRWR